MILELKDICKDYLQGKMVIPVLKHIDFQMEQGEYVAIMGPSGSGKTTLMNIVGCLDQATSGQFFLDGQDISKCTENEMSDLRLKKIGFVFQNFQLLSRQTALENVELPLTYAGVAKKERRERALQALTRVGLEDRVNFQPNQLSGGQKQRVAIARALATEPKVILCDEATSALDPNTTKSILALLKDLNRKMGITVVVITHEMDVISSICDNVAIIDKGDIVERGPVKEIFESPKSHIGKQLIMGDAIKETDFSGGRYFRITFDGREAGEPVISNLVLRTKVPVNIMYAQTKAIGNKAVGEMVIQFSENEENVDSALNYLETVNIPFEEVTENDF